MRPFLFFTLLFFSSLTFAAQKKLVVLGDSLSEGYGVAKEAAYPALVEKKLHDAGKTEWSIECECEWFNNGFRHRTHEMDF